jgi:hypothetical protein
MKYTKGKIREERYNSYLDISTTAGLAIQLMESYYADFRLKVNMISTEVERKDKGIAFPAGRAGVWVEIFGVTAWLGIEQHCEPMLEWGPIIMDEYLFGTVFKDIDLQTIIENNLKDETE